MCSCTGEGHCGSHSPDLQVWSDHDNKTHHHHAMCSYLTPGYAGGTTLMIQHNASLTPLAFIN